MLKLMISLYIVRYQDVILGLIIGDVTYTNSSKF